MLLDLERSVLREDGDLVGLWECLKQRTNLPFIQAKNTTYAL